MTVPVLIHSHLERMSAPLNVIEGFLNAWRRFDVDAVMSHFSQNAVFVASTGPEPGKTLVGQAAIRVVVEAMFKASPDSQFEVTGIWGSGADYFATWVMAAKGSESDAARVVGIDHFVVVDGLIELKDAYRKVYPS